MITSPQILCVFAQHAEARATIHHTRAQPVDGEKLNIWSEGVVESCYRFDHGLIVLSNVGLHAAQMCVAKYAAFCTEIWNFGLAGALKEGLPIGQILSIDCVGKYIPIDKDTVDAGTWDCLHVTVPKLTLQGCGGKLISSDFPIHDPSRKKKLSTEWDLVDMEGYGIAYAASALGKKCSMWKIISDFALPGGRDLIRKHKQDLSEQIAYKLLELIHMIDK